MSTIQQVLDDGAASGAVPGAVAVVVGPDGLRFQGAAGNTRADGDDPVTPDTMFRLASMTKALVSVAALQLVEEGALQLDTPVAAVLPAFGDLRVIEGFDGDTPRLRPPARSATIHELLTHTAGAGYFFGNPHLKRWHELTGTPVPTEGRLAALDAPLTSDPGVRWEYGTNTDWLGRVVEAVTGQGLDDVVAERVTEPLGMTDTSFTPDAGQRARLMPVHARTPDGGLAVTDFDWPAEPEFWAAGHGAYGTAGDYARFLAALVGDGSFEGARILRPETVDLAFTDGLRGAPLPGAQPTVMPELVNDIPELPWRQGWGLGFHLTLEDLEGMRRAGTGDWSGIFHTFFWIDRTTGVAAGLFTQVLPFFDAQVIGMLLAFEQAVYAGVGAAAVGA
jgi:CubicO group peptidase (beta-lactamase class C family)